MNKKCHCGKDGHAINSINCPMHKSIDWKKKFDDLEKEIMLMQGESIKDGEEETGHWRSWCNGEAAACHVILEKMKELRKE